MSPDRTAARLRDVPPTVFSEMSALALRTGAVNLGQGFPDSDGPAEVVERAVEAMRGGHNQYAPGPGVPELRHAVARHQQRHYGVTLDPETEVLVTAGATEAITAAVLGLVDPGDEVVMLEPSYDSYPAAVAMAGGVVRGVTLHAPDFRLEQAALDAAMSDRTALIVLNTPHNPTGRVLDADELTLVAAAAQRHDAVVVTDEVYEHLTFDGRRHVPLCTLPGMAERTVTASSSGKTFSLTGWKVGWASGPSELLASVMAAKQWLTFTNAAPLQPAVAHALDHASGFHEALAADLQSRRDLLVAALERLDMEVSRPEGTYFVTTDVSRYGHADGRAFCLALPERAGVVAIPNQGFYADPATGRHGVRWAFCKETATVEEGVRRLRAADLYA